MRVLANFVLSLFMFSSCFAADIVGNWKFPSDIAAKNGKLFVVDGLDNRIDVLKENGDLIKSIKINDPYGIDVEGNTIYVTSESGKLYVLNHNGRILRIFDIGGRPIDVIEADRKLFVTDGKTNAVKVYSLDGRFLKAIGRKGAAADEFVGPFLMDKSKRFLFVVDSVNARIKVFNHDGKLIHIFGNFGVEQGELFRPKGIAVCGDNVMVSDCLTGSVQEFSPFGGFERVVAKNLNYPTAVACDNGKVFVLEPLKSRVAIFNVKGVK